VNGPGKRFTLWVQGCTRHCAGCFNRNTHDKSEGYELSVDKIIKLIPFEEIDGITISGGEPFEQRKELYALLLNLAEKKKNILVYTGFTYDELCGMNDMIINECIKMIDILIDGPFQKNNPPITAWTGSGNQKVYVLNKTLSVDTDVQNSAEGEVIIDQRGEIAVSGFLNVIVGEGWL
jgi:anaerobic ribonucleoside-triphosphate reductase activating protein